MATIVEMKNDDVSAKRKKAKRRTKPKLQNADDGKEKEGVTPKQTKSILKHSILIKKPHSAEETEASSPKKRKKKSEVQNDPETKNKNSPSSRFQKPLGKTKKRAKSPKTDEGKATPDSTKSSVVAGKKRKLKDDGSDSKNKKPKDELQLSKKERKLLRKTTNNNYEVIVKAKQLWEVLRRHDSSKDEEKKLHLAQQLHNLIKGKVSQLIYAHDTSRVIECLTVMGNDDIRTALFEELKAEIVKLSMSKYSKFFVMKLMKHGSKQQLAHIIRKFYGKVVKLMKHTEAASVVEEAYNEFANKEQRFSLASEFYGPTYRLFKDGTAHSLQQICEADPSKKEAILTHLKEVLTQVLEKSVARHSLIHHVLYEYITHCSEKDRSELIESLREKVVEMLHTRDGSRVGMHCVWHGTAKDRKAIIKSMKTHVVKVCSEEHGHMVLLAILDSVDDTKLVTKALLDEMMTGLKEVIFHPSGRKVVLHLLSPRNPLHCHPDILKILRQGDGNANSKKETAIRTMEFLAAVSPHLTKFVEKNFKEMIGNPSATIVVQAVLRFAKGDVSAVHQKVVEVVAEPYYSALVGEKQHIIEDTAGHLFLKHLIRLDKERAAEKPPLPLFCDALLDAVPPSSYADWINCNRGCYILVSMIDTEIVAVSEKVKTFLERQEKKLAKKTFSGAKVLLKKLL